MKHYMRARRTGDPVTKRPVGRKPAPQGPSPPARDAEIETHLRRENETLHAQVATLQAEVSALRQQKPANDEALRSELAVAKTQIIALRRQLAQALAQVQAKPKAAPRPPPDPASEAAMWRKRYLAARAEIRHVTAAPRGQLVISKADRRAIQRCLHPDTSTDPAHKTRLTKAIQIFNALRMTEVDADV
jgi:hypothetical protein